MVAWPLAMVASSGSHSVVTAAIVATGQTVILRIIIRPGVLLQDGI